MNQKYNFGVKLNFQESNEELFFSSYISEDAIIKILNMMKNDVIFLGDKSIKDGEIYINNLLKKIGLTDENIVIRTQNLEKVENSLKGIENLEVENSLKNKEKVENPIQNLKKEENNKLDKLQEFNKKCDLGQKSCIGYNNTSYEKEIDLPDFNDLNKNDYKPIISRLF